MRGMFREIATAEQSPFQQITPVAARCRNCLIDDGFVTPNKLAPFLHHSPEEVHVFSRGIKFRSKRGVDARQDAPAEKHVACASFAPAHLKPCGVGGPLEESALLDPPRWVALEMWLHRSEYPVPSRRRIRLEYSPQPSVRGN